MSERVSNSDLNEWLQHPITKKFLEVLAEEAETLAYPLAQGTYSGNPEERLWMGYVRALREAINPENIRSELVFDSEEENE